MAALGNSQLLMMSVNQAAGVFFAAVGLTAWRARPEEPAGVLMVVMAELVLLSNPAFGLRLDTHMPASSVAVTIGVITEWAQFGLTARLLLGIAAPDLSRAWLPNTLVKAAWGLTILGPFILLPLMTSLPECGTWCGDSPFHWNHDASLYLSVRDIYVSAWAVLASCAMGVIARRAVRATHRELLKRRLALLFAAILLGIFVVQELKAVVEHEWSGIAVSPARGP
ncbi:hypothetical protein [Streptomyces sp. CdTB01]|uniref:hypothetical protein n=1 Tax=Streptomyces sp. CdTB01 TaxID=1725411 RepID=UPI00073AA764|nr:hypothetical protein [Streptomyces sp. CdTB01]ALV38260.1 hypothetical protein AS200_44275 [Streptomyces sp. CdTB01]